MAPILIDSRDILKLGFISILVTVLVFAGGFFMGHQRAATFYQAGNEVQTLPLPEQVFTTENVTVSQVPSVVVAGEDIDVDQPGIVGQKNNTLKIPTNDSVAIVSAMTVSSAENKKSSALQKKDVNKNISVDKNPSLKRRDTPVVTIVTSDKSNKIKYSIQVGMYGRFINAENMMKKLQAKQYDAYVSGYSNKKDERRYNVRFGYFFDKKTAVESLNKFKVNQAGDGYLVKFTVDNMIDMANANELEQVNDITAGENKMGDVSMPTMDSSDIVEDKFSRADILKHTFVTTN